MTAVNNWINSVLDVTEVFAGQRLLALLKLKILPEYTQSFLLALSYKLGLLQQTGEHALCKTPTLLVCEQGV
jgi:hypothetical protein